MPPHRNPISCGSTRSESGPGRKSRGQIPTFSIRARHWEPGSGAGQLLFFLLLLFLALAIYSPALGGGLIWDDDAHIAPPQLRSLEGLCRIWFEPGATQQYYPLLYTAFWLEHKLWGDSLVGYHLVNVILHATASFLLYLALGRLAIPGRWLASLVFCLHPVCVEAVAWISEQKTTLSAVFYLAALLCYLRFDSTRLKRHYFSASALFLMALLSKTVTATLPAALLLVFWWKRGRLDWRQDVLPLLPWFGLALPAGLFTAWVEYTHVGARGAEFALTFWQRLMLAGQVPWFYASKVFWPFGLAFSYPRWDVEPARWWGYLPLLGLVVLALAFFRLAARTRAPLASLLYYVGTLFPVLGFLNVYPFRYSWVADHFQYLAMPGLVAPAAALLDRLSSRNCLGHFLVAGVLALGLGALSWAQSTAYQDAQTLYRHTLARNPTSFLARMNLASLLVAGGHYGEAVEHFEAATRLRPGDADAWQNLGNALAQLPGRHAEAEQCLQKAAALRPDSAEIHNNLGLVLSSIQGRLPEAIKHFRTALELDPHFAAAHNNLGLALASQGHQREAIAEFQKAIELNPAYAAAYNNLGNAYASLPGHQDLAIQAFVAALRLDPGSALTYFNLANVYSEMPGRLPDAIQAYRAALRLDPRFFEAYVNLALALARAPGGSSEAAEVLRTAVQLRPDADYPRRLLASLEQAQTPKGK